MWLHLPERKKQAVWIELIVISPFCQGQAKGLFGFKVYLVQLRYQECQVTTKVLKWLINILSRDRRLSRPSVSQGWQDALHFYTVIVFKLLFRCGPQPTQISCKSTFLSFAQISALLCLAHQLLPVVGNADLAAVALALVTSRVGCCKVLYMGPPTKGVWKRHLVQNAVGGQLTGAWAFDLF